MGLEQQSHVPPDAELFRASEHLAQRSELQKVSEKDRYIEGCFRETKAALSRYMPKIFKTDLPIKLNYEEVTGETKLNYETDKDGWTISVSTSENITGTKAEELKKRRVIPEVLKSVDGIRPILKEVQDQEILSHEIAHIYFDNMVAKLRPDIVEVGKLKSEEEVRNSPLPGLQESFSRLVEKVFCERAQLDDQTYEYKKADLDYFWRARANKLSHDLLEGDPDTTYTEMSEAASFDKIYQTLGEQGIIDFISNLDYDKLSRIKVYSDPDKQILSDEYKKFLDMTGEELVGEFAPKKNAMSGEKESQFHPEIKRDDEIAEEIREILKESVSAIYTGIDRAGHVEFHQGKPDKAVSNVRDEKCFQFFRQTTALLKNPSLDDVEKRQLQNEADGSSEGSREKLFIMPSQNPDKTQLAYFARGRQEWKDASGRGGQELLVFVDIPNLKIQRIVGIIKEKPAILREIARQVVLEQIRIDQETWEHGSERTNDRYSHNKIIGAPLRPPYEVWDNEVDNPSVFVYSTVETVDLPRISRLEIKKVG